jgi:hypothetical protein
VTEHDIPQERDLPAGRLAKLKDHLMTQIEHDLETTPGAVPPGTHRRWRQVAVAAAAVAAGFGIATPLVLGGDGTASANTAIRKPDGEVLITIREGKHPEELQRRLVELGVPAVVDFLESGYGCDPARSTGWVDEAPGEGLFTWDGDAPEDAPQLLFNPDELEPGQTAVFEFQIDESGDEVAASVQLRLTTGEVGPCVPVPDDSTVDAEGGIAGG